MDYTLVVMAAGIGSRFGGLKQITPVGPNGEFIIDYSVYNAIRAGFNKVVFVIRKDFYLEFRETIGKRLEGKIKVEYVFQELTDLPKGYVCPEKRVKPWGTGAAIYSVRNQVSGLFAVINADDFFNLDAYKVMIDYIKNNKNVDECLAVCYEVGNTLSKNGSVKRGVALVKDGCLQEIKESRITSFENYALAKPLDDGLEFKISLDTLVTINLFVFTPKMMDIFVNYFSKFLDKNIDNLDSEYLIPDVINDAINNGDISFKVKYTNSKWHGVTYKEDKCEIENIIRDYIKNGVYPERLF